ncbi:GlyGly-CTERM sorting domain-containing protein [Streptococcus criceti]
MSSLNWTAISLAPLLGLRRR